MNGGLDGDLTCVALSTPQNKWTLPAFVRPDSQITYVVTVEVVNCHRFSETVRIALSEYSRQTGVSFEKDSIFDGRR